jgi:hypothetical protein
MKEWNVADIILWAGCDVHADPLDICGRCKTAIDMNRHQAEKLKAAVYLPWYTPDGRRPRNG